jgi:tellurite resistance protein
MNEPLAIEPGCLARALGLSGEQAGAAYGAALAVARADGDPQGPTAHLMDVVARALGTTADAPEAVSLAAAFPSATMRRALVDALVIVACIEGEISVARERAVRGIAKDLGVRSHWAELLPALRSGKVLTVKRALASRAPDARRLFRRTWQEEGVVGVARALSFVLGFYRDPPLAARFHALAESNEGSFGRAVADHFRDKGITYPGEKGGIPERMVHHDLLHILNGYDTDPAGECELAAFYCAFAEGDAFTFIMIALATFQLGLAVSPAVVTPARGAFDPERALAAFLRGRAVQVDVMGKWDYWALMPLPMAEARARLGIAGT